MNQQQPRSAMVAVCSKCLRATCWHGLFMCDEYQSAGIVEKSVSELRLLNREHEDYWTPSGVESLARAWRCSFGVRHHTNKERSPQ